MILCEKEDELGGILKSELALPFKYEMYQFAKTYEKMARDAGAQIRLNTEASESYIEKESPDVVIIAVGSTPFLPPIEGLDGKNVIVVNNYYREKEKCGEKIIVFGGGLAGCECAIHLGIEGKHVEIIEMREELAPDANIRQRPLLLDEINKYACVHTGLRGIRVLADGILCKNKNDEEVMIEGETIICALGQRSRTDIVEKLLDTAPIVSVIGDASKVSTITNAVYEGYHAALDI